MTLTFASHTVSHSVTGYRPLLGRGWGLGVARGLEAGCDVTQTDKQTDRPPVRRTDLTHSATDMIRWSETIDDRCHYSVPHLALRFAARCWGEVRRALITLRDFAPDSCGSRGRCLHPGVTFKALRCTWGVGYTCKNA